MHRRRLSTRFEYDAATEPCEESPMLIFINTPALARSLGLSSFDEALPGPRPERRRAVGDRRRVALPRAKRWVRGSWLARSLHLAH
jgi:hypothetical protein